MNSNFLLSVFISFIIYLIIDGTMIALYTGPLFGKMIKNIQGGVEMNTRLIPAILCFIVLAFGVNYFVLDKVRDNHIFVDSIKYGFIFGLIVYAVYDLTNYATFGKYTLKVTIIDILWGATLAFLVTIITKYAMKIIGK